MGAREGFELRRPHFICVGKRNRLHNHFVSITARAPVLQTLRYHLGGSEFHEMVVKPCHFISVPTVAGGDGLPNQTQAIHLWTFRERLFLG